MVKFRFYNWYRKAVSLIIYPQDRINVEQELKNHMEDRYEALLEQGHSHEEAELLTLKAMGDPMIVARELAKIYRPFWGLVQIQSKKVLKAVFCILLFIAASSFTAKVTLGQYRTIVYDTFHPYKATRYIDDSGHYNRLYYAEPGNTVISDGFYIKATRTSLWKYSPHMSDTDSNTFYLQLKFIGLLPWIPHDADVTNLFWAEDNLGNIYAAFNDQTEPNQPTVVRSYWKTAPLTHIHNLTISNFAAEDAQWIDLHYDRAGRNLIMRIYLNGGDA